MQENTTHTKLNMQLAHEYPWFLATTVLCGELLASKNMKRSNSRVDHLFEGQSIYPKDILLTFG